MMKRLIILSTVALIALSGCSLAGDVTPPPNSSLPTVTPEPVATGEVFPLVVPDSADGQAIYAEKCTPCHGPDGLGNGDLAEKAPVPVPAIGDPAVARAARLADWYTLLTVGNMANGMPSFRSLTDRQRWDVAAFTYWLSVPPEALATGQQVYAEQCAACHGDDGAGDGATMTDWTKFGSLSNQSDEELAAVTRDGRGEMPAFSSLLSADQIWSVTAYLRTLAVAGEESAPPIAAGDSAVVEAPQSVTLRGRVEMLSGGVPPADLPVTLQAYDNMTLADEIAGVTNADGTFEFVDMPYAADRVYVAVLTYMGAQFTSNPIHATDVLAGAVPEMVISLYGTTTDTSALTAERLHVIFDFSDPTAVNVAEIFLITNTGDALVVPENGQPVMSFVLPAGAANVLFPDDVDGTRFVMTDTGFGDTAAIAPGSGHQVVVVFTLPPSARLNLSFHTPVAVDSTVVMIAGSAEPLVVKSSQLNSEGERTVQGTAVELYTGGSLASGDALDLTISTRSQIPTLPIGLAALGLVVIGAAVLIFRRKKQSVASDSEEVKPTEEELLDAIIALDDQFTAGNIDEAAYQRRRADLKAQISQLRGGR